MPKPASTTHLVFSYPDKPTAQKWLPYWAKQAKTLRLSGLVFVQRIQGTRNYGIFAVATMPTNIRGQGLAMRFPFRRKRPTLQDLCDVATPLPGEPPKPLEGQELLRALLRAYRRAWLDGTITWSELQKYTDDAITAHGPADCADVIDIAGYREDGGDCA